MILFVWTVVLTHQGDRVIPILEFSSEAEAVAYMTRAIDAEYVHCGLSLFERRIAPMPDIGSAVRTVLIAHLTQNEHTRRECEIMIVNIPNEYLDQIMSEMSGKIGQATTHATIVLAVSNKIIEYWNSLPTAP